MPSEFFIIPLIFVCFYLLILFISRARRLSRIKQWKTWDNILRKRYPEEIRNEIAQDFTLYRIIDEETKNHLDGYIHLFLRQVNFEPRKGMGKISERMKRSVAAQACILLAGQERAWFHGLKTVSLYPYDLTQSYNRPNLESFRTNNIHLSWPDVVTASKKINHGSGNAITRQFSLHLDAQHYYLNGIPKLGPEDGYKRWKSILSDSLDTLLEKIKLKENLIFSENAIQSKSVFFAAATEAFLTNPIKLQHFYPNLYRMLEGYYHINPVQWREQILALKYPGSVQHELTEDLAIYRTLPPELCEKLEGLMHLFLIQVDIKAAEGMHEITDRMKRLIAAKACLLVLNRPLLWYELLHEVLVFADSFVYEDGNGLIATSLNNGKVILGWKWVESSASRMADGFNISTRNFAYQLDYQYQGLSGSPYVEKRNRRRWLDVTARTYRDQQVLLANGKTSFLDGNRIFDKPAFFATVSEVFFASPQLLHHHHPELYDVFRNLYSLDPLDWRARFLIKRLSENQRAELKEDFLIYHKLTPSEQQRLEGLMHLFLVQVTITPRNGMKRVTDRMKRLVAAQACLLIIGQPGVWYELLKEVWIYPEPYFVEGESLTRLGESNSEGVVILTWPATARGSAIITDGHDLSIHEFAHQLDKQFKNTPGIPRLKNHDEHEKWTRVCNLHFQALCELYTRGEETIIDQYATKNRLEFFAVVTETFFEKPRQLNQEYPELYQVFKDYYGQNPLKWLT